MYEFKVSGMSCGSCANAITHALKTIDPKVKVSVDIKNQTVRVESSKSEAEITNLVQDAGYPVLEAKQVS